MGQDTHGKCVCFDSDVQLQYRAGIHLDTIMANHLRAMIFTAHLRYYPSLPPSSLPTVLQRSRRYSTFLHHSCVRAVFILGTAVFMQYVSVCERVNRHLEGHDEVCEVKLSLQVKLDGRILHTCQKNQTNKPQSHRKLTILFLDCVEFVKSH